MQDAFEPLAGMALDMRGKFGRNDRMLGMDFGAGMACDEPDDPLDLRGREPRTRWTLWDEKNFTSLA